MPALFAYWLGGGAAAPPPLLPSPLAYWLGGSAAGGTGVTARPKGGRPRKITVAHYQEVRKAYPGASQARLAKMLGVSRRTIKGLADQTRKLGGNN